MKKNKAPSNMDIIKNLGMGLLKGLVIAGAISYFLQLSNM